MTNQEKWDEIVSKIEELRDELQELVDSIPVETKEDDIRAFPIDPDSAIFGLGLSIEELREQELD
jgi:hypothetical protein